MPDICDKRCCHNGRKIRQIRGQGDDIRKSRRAERINSVRADVRRRGAVDRR